MGVAAFWQPARGGPARATPHCRAELPLMVVSLDEPCRQRAAAAPTACLAASESTIWAIDASCRQELPRNRGAIMRPATIAAGTSGLIVTILGLAAATPAHAAPDR